jgi:hypothetical protein
MPRMAIRRARPRFTRNRGSIIVAGNTTRAPCVGHSEFAQLICGSQVISSQIPLQFRGCIVVLLWVHKLMRCPLLINHSWRSQIPTQRLGFDAPFTAHCFGGSALTFAAERKTPKLAEGDQAHDAHTSDPATARIMRIYSCTKPRCLRAGATAVNSARFEVRR